MTIGIADIIEYDDGSADIQFEVSDEQETRQLVGEGLNFLLIKVMLNCNTEELLRWAERGKQEEKTDHIVSKFGEIYNDDTK